jgi:hypothetical protein
MYTSYDVGVAGERAAVADLGKAGWRISKWDTKAPGSTDIEATNADATIRLLVQVKSAASPSEPVALSSDEERNIKSRSAKVGAKAYEAKVWLDSALSATKVSWRELT